MVNPGRHHYMSEGVLRETYMLSSIHYSQNMLNKYGKHGPSAKNWTPTPSNCASRVKAVTGHTAMPIRHCQTKTRILCPLGTTSVQLLWWQYVGKPGPTIRGNRLKLLVVRMKTRLGFVLVDGVDAVEIGISLTHHPMNPLREEIPGLLLEPLHHRSLDVFLRPETTAL